MATFGWQTFLLYDAIGAVLRCAAWLGAGNVFGELLQQLLGQLKHVEVRLLAAVGTVVLAMAATFHWRDRRIAQASSSKRS